MAALDDMIGANVRMARRLAGFTLEQLAFEARMRPAVLAAGEAGALRFTPRQLLLLAELLGVSVSSLLGRRARHDGGQGISAPGQSSGCG